MRNRLFLSGMALTMALVATPAHAAESDAAKEQNALTPGKVLVMKLHAFGTDDGLIERVVRAYAGVIASRPGFEAVTAFDVRELLEQAADGQAGVLDGCEEAACWQLATSAMSTSYVVGGSIGMVGKEMVISLSLIDSNTRLVASVTETVTDADDAVAAGPSLLGRLFGWGTEAPAYTLPEGKKVSLATFDLKVAEIDAETGKSLSQVLAEALKDVEGLSVITQDDIRTMLELEAQKQALGCDDAACFAEIGGALGVDKMVVGYVTNLAGRYVVSLRLIDGRSAEVNARVTESYKGDKGQLVSAVRFAGRKLLGLELAEAGTMAVSSSEPEATVFLNDQKQGELPMPSVGDLDPGLYRVRVSKGGFYDWLTEVYVEPQGTTAVWAPLEEKPPAWYATWWFWTGVGVLAAGATTFYVLQSVALPETELGNVDVR